MIRGAMRVILRRRDDEFNLFNKIYRSNIYDIYVVSCSENEWINDEMNE